MGRPYGTKNKMRTPEEKEKIVIEYLNGNIGQHGISEKYEITRSVFQKWLRKYQMQGKEGFISKTGKKTGINTGRPKRCTSEEEKLRQQIVKLEIEVARLKKGYGVKGVGAKKEYITIFEENTK